MMLIGSTLPSIAAMTIIFMLCFAALGAGNGSLFQLVPLRWPTTTAVAGSMIGEIGALGGAFIPNAMGLSKQYTGTFAYGFLAFAIFAIAVLIMLRIVQRKWTTRWVAKGGKALMNNALSFRIQSADEYEMLQRQGRFYGV